MYYTNLVYDNELDEAINKVVQYFPKGKAVSTDLIPDETFSKDELKTLVMKDKGVLFKGPLLEVMKNARCTILSKTGKKIQIRRTPDLS